MAQKTLVPLLVTDEELEGLMLIASALELSISEAARFIVQDHLREVKLLEEL